MTSDIVDDASMRSQIIIVKTASRRGKEGAMRLTKEQALANRSAIVAAAGRLFRERGFDAVTVADLMEAAGLAPPSGEGIFPASRAGARSRDA